MIEIATKRKPKATGQASTNSRSRASHTRDYSFGMNCAICHDTKISAFREPSKTMFFMDGNLAPSDYSGQVGPQAASRALAIRHNNRGHAMMADLYVEKMDEATLMTFPCGIQSGVEPQQSGVVLALPDASGQHVGYGGDPDLALIDEAEVGAGWVEFETLGAFQIDVRIQNAPPV